MAASMSSSPIAVQLQTANSKPLQKRCVDVENIIKTLGTKELRNALPQLLESIFGFGTDVGWGLEMISRTFNAHEFDAVRRLLAPEGPLLSLVYNLQTDPYLSYEFNMSCLPAPTRHIIEDGGIPMFYASKLQYQTYGRPVIVLNAFEYYMFHFMYCLVNPQWQKRNGHWNNLADCLYPCLCEDYMNYFLPLNKDHLPAMPNVTPAVRNPVINSPVSGGKSPNQTPPRSAFRIGLLKSSVLATQKQHTQGSPVLGQNEAETYRSETLVQVLVEFWLNQNPVSIERCNVSPNHMDQFVPTTSHIRLVRMMIKHIHNFVNTATPDLITAPYQSQILSPLDDFKKSLLPQIIQKKLYAFLRHGFDRWPLDSSFRVVLETWLTYIQPWRYIPNNTSQRTVRRDSDTETKTVEEKWISFVEENMLFYTVLFQEFLQRVFRMDLTTLFNACMVFRVMKVFSLPNLSNMIQRAERDLCSSLRIGRMDLGGSYLSTETSLTLHTQISELEKPGFQYVLIYGEGTIQAVQQVLKQIELAKLAIKSSEQDSIKPQKTGWAAIFDVSSWFDDSGSKGFGDLTASEVKKLEYYLDVTTRSICYIFQIPQPQYISEGISSPSKFDQSSLMGTSYLSDSPVPDCLDTDKGLELSPLGRYQLMNKVKKFDIIYQGDPDLQPIRSFENGTLVRLLHCFCNYVNTQFGEKICDMYEREDVIGRLAHIFFAPSLNPDKPLNSPLSASMRQRLERPRLSLRFLASYKILIYLLSLYVLMRLWLGFGPVSFFFMLMFFVFVYGLLKSVVQPSRHKQS